MRTFCKKVLIAFVLAVTAASAGLLLVAGIVYLVRTGFGGWWGIFGVACCLAAVVVAWVGWYLFRLIGSATSLTQQLSGSGGLVRTRGPAVINELAEAVSLSLRNTVNRSGELAEQLSQLEMQRTLTTKYLHPLKLERAQATLDAAAQELALAREQLTNCTVTAPSGGMVVHRPLHLGTEYRTGIYYTDAADAAVVTFKRILFCPVRRLRKKHQSRITSFSC